MSDKVKIEGCTCEYPAVIYNRSGGHHPTCPLYRDWRATHVPGDELLSERPRPRLDPDRSSSRGRGPAPERRRE